MVDVAKKVAIVGLIVLLLLLAIPLGIAFAMDGCPMCPPGDVPHMIAICFGLLVTISLTFALFASRIEMQRVRAPVLLFARSLERPPRFI